MSKNKILYIVATQYDNLGDFLINKCLIDEIGKYGDVYLDLKNVPQDFGNHLLDGKNLFPLSKISSISVKGKGLGLIPFTKSLGFTHVFKSPGPFGGAHTLNDKLRAVVFYSIFYLFKKKGAKSYLIGNDLIISSHFDQKIFKASSKVLSGMFVRSKKNLEEFEDLNIPAAYSPDMCFLFEPRVLKKVNERKKIGISFRDLDDKLLDEKIRESINIIIEYYKFKNVSIEFFCQVDRDKSYTHSLYVPYKQMANISFRNEILSWEDRNYYNDFKVVASNRLHVLLLAQKFLAIPAGIVNDHKKTHKIKAVFDSIGLPKFIKPKVISEDLDDLERNHLDIIKKLVITNDEQKGLLKEIFFTVLS